MPAVSLYLLECTITSPIPPTQILSLAKIRLHDMVVDDDTLLSMLRSTRASLQDLSLLGVVVETATGHTDITQADFKLERLLQLRLESCTIGEQDLVQVLCTVGSSLKYLLIELFEDPDGQGYQLWSAVSQYAENMPQLRETHLTSPSQDSVPAVHFVKDVLHRFPKLEQCNLKSNVRTDLSFLRESSSSKMEAYPLRHATFQIKKGALEHLLANTASLEDLLVRRTSYMHLESVDIYLPAITVAENTENSQNISMRDNRIALNIAVARTLKRLLEHDTNVTERDLLDIRFRRCH